MEIALCLSGGGYRAAVFHLGVMSYLNKVNMPLGGKLLDRVHTISCISGGALPGFYYLLSKARGRDVDEEFKHLYHLLINNGLSSPLLEDFEKHSGRKKGLIESLASVYDAVFFHNAKFGEILDYVSWDGIHHFAVDATDFELGMPFRFQATDRIDDPDRDEEYGVIGNFRHKIERSLAHEIRIADIMAATSCFPLVFEPFTFPNDFFFENSTLQDALDVSYVLMDGGLVDNQGIDPALHAEEHLKTLERSHDLLILSDAGNMNAEEKINPVSWTRLSPDKYFWIIYIFTVLSGVGSIALWIFECFFFSGCCLILFVVLLSLLCLIRIGEEKVMRYISSRGNLSHNYDFIWKNTVNSIVEFVRARFNTAHRMVDVIMMGHMKRSSYKVLFKSSIWVNKVMLNSLFMLSGMGKWSKALSKRRERNKSMTPSRRIRQNSDKANQMKTTLWFSEEERRTKMPEAILACGQYTICWNLLQHIDRWKSLPDEQLTDGQKELIGIEGILKGDWERFKKNPSFMTLSYRRA